MTKRKTVTKPQKENPYRLSNKEPILHKEPYAPPDFELADAASLQALQRGEATEEQQKRALDWIVKTAACTYDLSYRPTDNGDTDFAEGKRFVGLSIVKLLNINIAKLRGESNVA